MSSRVPITAAAQMRRLPSTVVPVPRQTLSTAAAAALRGRPATRQSGSVATMPPTPCAAAGFHDSAIRRHAKPMNPDPRENPAHDIKPPAPFEVGNKSFADFNIAGRVFIVTGGGRGLGLTLAEALGEAGGKVYCLDVFPQPDSNWTQGQQRILQASDRTGSLTYRQQDVVDVEGLDHQIASIAEENGRLDGVIAAAGIQQITPAIEYKAEDVSRMMNVNYQGVLMTATSAARQMFRYRCRGSMVFIASISGSVANKGLISPVYNSSKAAVVQLARNLAMEWSPIRPDGTGGIRVNCISPGHILTPMVQKNFEEVPGLREKWEAENMMGRLAETHEFKGAALFLLSNASSFMTGGNLIMDGGHTAW